MIRRFIGLLIFVCTVLIASFGQEIVNRDTITAWAEKLGHEAPIRSRVAFHKTDLFMAALSPQAGTARNETETCSFDVPQ